MKTKQKKRNGHAFHPIMKKGGVHEESKSSKRRKAKDETKKLAEAWKNHASFLNFQCMTNLHSCIYSVASNGYCSQISAVP
jgi:hypothetical protein